MSVPGLASSFHAAGQGVWRVDGDALVGRADGKTDLFADPTSPTDDGVNAASMHNAPRLLTTPPDGDFQLSARVDVEFAGTFDAGVLLLWSDERIWAKLCFEFSPQGQPMVVSVVTRDVSDDANGFTVDGRTVWLRVSRVEGTYAYHASMDGHTWQFVRHFSLGDASIDVGFEVQAPIGPDACTATFTQISFTPTTVADLRDGT